MFRKSLLAATALVLCVANADAGGQTGRSSDGIVPRFMKPGGPMQRLHGFPLTAMTGHPPTAVVLRNAPPKYDHAIFDNIDWNSKNQKWLNDYGFATFASSSCYYHSSHSHHCFSETLINALAFYGTGKKAKKIGVPLGALSGSGTEFNIAIYSATPSGLPGNSELAGGSATANDTGRWPLTWVNVNVKLKAKQEYFLEVSCEAGQNCCDGAWFPSVYEGTDYWHMKLHETYNFGSGTHTYSDSSPWHASSTAEGAAIIK
jgi:hypothetical protein